MFEKALQHVFLSTSVGNVGNAVATIGFAAVFLRLRAPASLPQFLNYSTSFCLQAVGDGRDTLLHAVVRELVFYIPFMPKEGVFTKVLHGGTISVGDELRVLA